MCEVNKWSYVSGMHLPYMCYVIHMDAFLARYILVVHSTRVQCLKLIGAKLTI